MVACTEDLSEFHTRADELKNANAKEQQKIEEEKRRLEEEKKREEALKQQLDSLENAMKHYNDDIDSSYVPYLTANLPMMGIITEGRKNIESRDSYLNATMELSEMSAEGTLVNVINADLQIKGRGNTTWGLPKKPYRLKFIEKTSLLGEHKDRSWVLLANFMDKSMLRNKLAFLMGKMSNLDWTPSSHFIDLTLNGEYMGTYELVEKLKVNNHRVAVGDDGFLLEIDQRASGNGDVYFTTSYLGQPVKFRDPDVQENDANYIYARDFVNRAERSLFSANFIDSQDGWQKYIDMDSFVDWYLINELAKNNDAIFFTSCYMNFKRDGKLKMGPLWDFDLAFGNINYNDNFNPNGFWIKNHVKWYSRMFQDPAFVARIKERFNYFYSHRYELYLAITKEAIALKESVAKNENKWHTLYNYTWPNYNIWGSYNNEIQYLKEWLNRRFEWMKIEIDQM